MITTHSQIPQENTCYALTHLAAIEVTGQDASSFLQGQLTCDINALSITEASFAGFCNPKGRVLSLLLVIKTQQGFFLILPFSLLEKVLKKLHLYILRSKVFLKDISGHSQINGLYLGMSTAIFPLPSNDLQCAQSEQSLYIKLPGKASRYIEITSPAVSSAQTFKFGNENEWRYHDISAGIPWFDAAQSEQFIPQMLNIDQLGGISFNKGCYTGQEIVARTHYLGKTKRQLILGECAGNHQGNDLSIIDASTGEKAGEILTIQSLNDWSRMLIVLQIHEAEQRNLVLAQTHNKTPLTLIPFH